MFYHRKNIVSYFANKQQKKFKMTRIGSIRMHTILHLGVNNCFASWRETADCSALRYISQYKTSEQQEATSMSLE
jgi:hypothetical protein